MFNGCYTALITPMNNDFSVDYDGLRRLVDFQLEQGINGILAVGTTGESPTLDWSEHLRVIKETLNCSKNRTVIAGTGSNSTLEALNATHECVNLGIKNILLVDPYYNGPSSLEIRLEYITPIAQSFPDTKIIPYIIPGRTGTQLLPQDLSILTKNFSNITAVKEATCNFDNMRLTRKLCSRINILSGDDEFTYDMMVDKSILASGVISVASNIIPGAITRLTGLIKSGQFDEASKLNAIIKPLTSIVTVKTEELPGYFCKARNPLPYKTLMNILGMPSGPCRKPLGKMTLNGFNKLINALRKVYEESPELLRPIEDFFNVDLSDRLYQDNYSSLIYQRDY